MPWIIDTDLLVEGERGDPRFVQWLQSADTVATADIIRAEFLLGVHAVADEVLRKRGAQFYAQTIALLPSLPSDPSDYAKAAQLAGDARRTGKGSPGLVDGLIAALALRTSATSRDAQHARLQRHELSLLQSLGHFIIAAASAKRNAPSRPMS